MSRQVRDAVARLEGWTTYKASNGLTVWEFGSIEHGTYTTATAHPIPDDLIACAKAWDDHAGGLVLCMHVAYLTARERNGKGVKAIKRTGKGVKAIKRTGHDAASELRDRWALLGLALKARGVV